MLSLNSCLPFSLGSLESLDSLDSLDSFDSLDSLESLDSLVSLLARGLGLDLLLALFFSYDIFRVDLQP